MGYEQAAALARRLLKKKGKSVVLTKPNTGTANHITGARGAGAPLTSVFNCVGFPAGKSAEYHVGSLVKRKVHEFHLARTAGNLDPEPGMLLPWGGKQYTLLWAAVYDPDDTGMVYAKAYGEVA
jgi:hypothetical protein